MDDSILCLKWKDKRDVLLLSTLHDGSMVAVQRKRCISGGTKKKLETKGFGESRENS